MRTVIILAALFLITGCKPPNIHSKNEQPQAKMSTLEGQHTSNIPHTAMGKFAPYTSYGMLANCTATSLSAWFPTFGRRTVTMVAGDWNYGDKGEWRGSFTEPDGKTWYVHLTVDVYSAVSIVLTDGRNEGLSDSIAWKCLPRGNG